MSQTIRVRLVFTEGMLGTKSADAEVFKNYIASKAPDALTKEEEVDKHGTEEVFDKARTVFFKTEDGEPFLYDYQIKGFFKDACSMLSRLTKKNADGKKVPENESGKLSAYKKVIDGLIFPAPREIVIKVNGEITDCQRPLRAQTAQGERVCLASSDEVPAGSTIEFEVLCLDDSHVKAVREWLDYGRLRGIGQWRNSGAGRFNWDELDADGNVIGGNNAYSNSKAS